MEGKMYLVIFEDGQVYSAEKITKDDMNAADSGIIDIINCDLMSQYSEDEWHPIKTWGA
jgi:hypothetical protein